MSELLLTALAIGSYFLGAVPVGVLVAKSRGVDILATGSGNPGATNVWRTCGAGYGLLVFVLDIAKGLLPALLARRLTIYQEAWFGFGLLAVVGHSLSPFLKFKGGKGVSTALGATLGAAPLVAGIAFATFVLSLTVTRFVSLSSIIAVTMALAGSIVLPGQSRWLVAVFAPLWLLVVVRHRDNIRRLLDGTERRFSLRKSEPSSPAPADEEDDVGRA